MTVFLGPDEGMRYCPGPNGVPAASRMAVIYTDVSGTIPAAIRTYDGSGTPGALIANSTVTTDIYGQLPLFWFPDFVTGTVPTLYVRVNGATGPVVPIGPDMNVRVTALEAGGGGGGGGTPSGTVTTETTYGQASNAGAATAYSRGDHTHGSPPLTSAAATASAVGDAAAAGTATLPAKADHLHGREAFGAVSAETTYGTGAANGAATTVARSDHAHGNPALSAVVATTSAVGDAAAIGVGTVAARSDHVHGREAFGAVTAATSYGLASANGSALTEARADHMHGTPALTAVTPSTSAVGDAATLGTGTAPAKEDHRHGREAFGAVTAATSFGAASATGSAVTVSHSDHNHGSPSLSAVAASTSAVGDAATIGAATTAAKADHVHGREAFGAVTAQTAYGSASTNGVAVTEARADHAHGTVSLPTPAQVGSPALSSIAAKGDLYVGTGAGTIVNLTVGANTNVLTADSTQASGVKWAAGGAGSYSLPDGIDPPSGSPHAVPNGPVGANLTTVQNRGYMVPVPMGNTTRTLNEISIEVATAGAAGTVFRVVLWSATGRVPNVSFADLGTVAGDTTGVKAITGLSNVLSTGTLYFIQVIEQVATGAALRAVASYNPYVTLQGGSLVGSAGFAAYVMSGLSGAVTNGTAFVYFDVDSAPRLGLKFA